MEKIILKYVSLVVIIFGVAYWSYETYAMASDAQTKANNHDETFDKIAQIADATTSPSFWLRNYLLLHLPQKDSSQAVIWSNFPIGPVVNDNGLAIMNVPFLLPDSLPDVGLYVIIEPVLGDTLTVQTKYQIKIIKTLWNFREKK